MYLLGPSTTQFEDEIHDALLGEEPEDEEVEKDEEDRDDEKEDEDD